jgi:hypothetical protein
MVQETDLSLRILRLEQKLESYQKLHAEELNEIRLALAELKKQVLALAAVHDAALSETQQGASLQDGHETRSVGTRR